jgi:Holliday junction resolvasome RuvABC DNA-binding subunit
MLDGITCSRIEARDSGTILAYFGPLVLSLQCSQRDCQELSRRGAGTVYCHLEVDQAQGHLRCLAFASEERRTLYMHLRGVPGVGRVSALAVLDTGEVIDVLRAVSGREEEFFSQIPGLGPKRARAVIEHLRRRYSAVLPRALENASVADFVVAREVLVHRGFPLEQADLLLLEVLEGKKGCPDAFVGREDISGSPSESGESHDAHNTDGVHEEPSSTNARE